MILSICVVIGIVHCGRHNDNKGKVHRKSQGLEKVSTNYSMDKTPMRMPDLSEKCCMCLHHLAKSSLAQDTGKTT